MNARRVGSAFAATLLTTATFAGDLASIDRRIGREPGYVGQPYYALLAFAPEAERTAWIVVDGETLYVDRNGDGDLTGADERVGLDVEATKKINLGPGAGHTGMNVFEIGEVAGARLGFQFWVRKEGHEEEHELLKRFQKEREENGWENGTLWRVNEDESRAQNPVIFCRRPEDVQISHLDGPLTFTLAYDEARTGKRQTLKRPRDGVFSVNIGTQGAAAKNCRFSIFSPLTTTEVPSDVHPVARFEFESKTTGAPAIKSDVALDQRCCGDTFYGRVDVPDDAGDAPAKVTVEFPAWPEGNVEPATFEVPLE